MTLFDADKLAQVQWPEATTNSSWQHFNVFRYFYILNALQSNKKEEFFLIYYFYFRKSAFTFSLHSWFFANKILVIATWKSNYCEIPLTLILYIREFYNGWHQLGCYNYFLVSPSVFILAKWSVKNFNDWSSWPITIV